MHDATTLRPSTPTAERLIAIFKLVKSALFLCMGLVLIHLLHAPDLEDAVAAWLSFLHIDPQGRLVNQLLTRLADVPPENLRALGLGAFAYAALYLTEGIGLWFDRLWAAWLSVAGGAALVPLEVIHLVNHPSWGIATVLVLNLAVVGYLAQRIRVRHRERSKEAAPPENS